MTYNLSAQWKTNLTDYFPIESKYYEFALILMCTD